MTKIGKCTTFGSPFGVVQLLDIGLILVGVVGGPLRMTSEAPSVGLAAWIYILEDGCVLRNTQIMYPQDGGE